MVWICHFKLRKNYCWIDLNETFHKASRYNIDQQYHRRSAVKIYSFPTSLRNRIFLIITYLLPKQLSLTR